MPEYSATRWFADAQRDFASRLRWTVTPSYEQANHHPTAAVSPGVDMAAPPGESVLLTAKIADPDGGAVSCRWWQYREAGTFRGEVSIEDADTPMVIVRIPDDAVAGQTVHLILEVQNDAELPLKAYQRGIVTIAGGDGDESYGAQPSVDFRGRY